MSPVRRKSSWGGPPTSGKWRAAVGTFVHSGVVLRDGLRPVPRRDVVDENELLAGHAEVGGAADRRRQDRECQTRCPPRLRAERLSGGDHRRAAKISGTAPPPFHAAAKRRAVTAASVFFPCFSSAFDRP